MKSRSRWINPYLAFALLFTAQARVFAQVAADPPPATDPDRTIEPGRGGEGCGLGTGDSVPAHRRRRARVTGSPTEVTAPFYRSVIRTRMHRENEKTVVTGAVRRKDHDFEGRPTRSRFDAYREHPQASRFNVDMDLRGRG